MTGNIFTVLLCVKIVLKFMLEVNVLKCPISEQWYLEYLL